MTVLPELRAEVVRSIERPRRRVVRVRTGPLVTAGAVAAVIAALLFALPDKGDEVPAGAPPELTSSFGVLRRAPTESDRNALAFLRTRFMPQHLEGLQEDTVRRVGRNTVLFAVAPGSPLGSGLCLDATSGSRCWDLAELRAGKTLQSSVEIAGIVPDGVASVLVQLHGSTDATVEVRDNVFELTVPDGHSPGGVTWRDRDGRPVGP